MSIPLLDRQLTIHDYIPGQPIPALIKDAITGKAVKNPIKQFVKPYTLSIEPETVTLAADGSPSDFIPLPIDGKGSFEIMQGFFKSQRSEGFTVQLYDAMQRPILMNREVHVATIASGVGTATNYESFGVVGSAGRLFRWPETLFMDEKLGGRCIFAVFRNLSTSANVIRFGFHGLKWYHAQAPQRVADRMQQITRGKVKSMPFFYTTDQHVTIPADDSVNQTIRFTDEGWTEWIKGMVVSGSPFNVRISEVASNRRYMEDLVPDASVLGDGELPFLNWESALFEPNFQLNFEMENTVNEANVVWLTLGCRKILPDVEDTKLLRPGEASGGGMR